jgi:hypothetical protein
MEQQQTEHQEETARATWNSPQLTTHGTVAALTQTQRCKHGNPYPCKICTTGSVKMS